MNSSPAYFQRLLDFVLQGIDRVYVYIDDVVISVNSHSQNLQKLEEVFKRFRKHNLKIKPSKCQFRAAKITYLGYDICNNKGISPGEAKTEVIKKWPAPTSIQEIKGFIGLTSFFCRAIKYFSVISADLNKLIRKNSGYSHGPLPPNALDSFNKLKAALISLPCLSPVYFNKRFYVTCDASATHYGSCLSQIGDDGIERPCGYDSKLLSKKEAKQQPGIRKRASILFPFRHWHLYLVGKEFTCRTDHKPNLSLFQGKTEVYDSMSDEIMSYLPFKLEYLNGKDMFENVLSRLLGFVSNVNAIPVDPTDIPLLLKQAHDDAGHLNHSTTRNTLRQNFTWPNMAKDVETYVRSCLACQQNNPSRPGNVAPLQNLSTPAEQFGDRIHLDLVDMPKSNEGHVAICTLVDVATSYTILRPELDKTSRGVSDTLMESFTPYFGCPTTLVTDKGRENINSEIKLLTTTLNIKHIVSSTHLPQSNGLIERRQQMISIFMRKTCEDVASQQNWHLKIPNLQTIITQALAQLMGFPLFSLLSSDIQQLPLSGPTFKKN